MDRLMYQERELEDDLIFDLDPDRLTDGSARLLSPCEVTRVGGCFYVNRLTDGSARLLASFRLVVSSMN